MRSSYRLYSGIMQNYSLPINSFEFIEGLSQNDILQMLEDPNIGCFVECDVEYVREKHDEHKDYPLLCEKMRPPNSVEESRNYSYQSTLKSAQHEKLLCTLYNKKDYVMHGAMFKFILAQGLKVTKIGKVLRFRQANFIRKYIEVNTRMRQQSTNDFEKQLWKNNSNILFGKCCERVNERRQIKLKTKFEGRWGAQNMIANPAFKRITVFSENLVAVESQVTRVKMDKPSFIGAAILDLSKLVMAEFHYDFVIPEFGTNVTQVYTDTDSFCYEFRNIDNVYNDFIKKYIDKFDTSDYPPNNIHGIELMNKKVPLLMKDENNSIVMSEFCGLRAKMYATRVQLKDAVKKAKGVKKTVRNRLTFEHFKKCVFEHCSIVESQNSIRSKNHNVFTITQKKLALNGNDNKRYILPNNIDTLPWGHYSI